MEMLGGPSQWQKGLCWRSGSALKQQGYLRDTCPLRLLPSQSVPDTHQSSSGRGTRYSGPRFVVVYFQPYYLPTIQFPEAIVQRA